MENPRGQFRGRDPLADNCGTQVYRVPRKTVRATFSSTKKYDITRIIAVRFTELKPLCPPRRKVWQSENPRIDIFRCPRSRLGVYRCLDP